MRCLSGRCRTSEQLFTHNVSTCPPCGLGFLAARSPRGLESPDRQLREFRAVELGAVCRKRCAHDAHDALHVAGHAASDVRKAADRQELRDRRPRRSQAASPRTSCCTGAWCPALVPDRHAIARPSARSPSGARFHARPGSRRAWSRSLALNCQRASATAIAPLPADPCAVARCAHCLPRACARALVAATSRAPLPVRW